MRCNGVLAERVSPLSLLRTGIHVETDLRTDQELQPLAVAKILAFLARRDKPDLFILGKQAIDGKCKFLVCRD